MVKQLTLLGVYYLIFGKLRDEIIFNGKLYTNISFILTILTVLFLVYDHYNIIRIIYYKFKDEFLELLKSIDPNISLFYIILIIVNSILTGWIKGNDVKLFHIDYQTEEDQKILIKLRAK